MLQVCVHAKNAAKLLLLQGRRNKKNVTASPKVIAWQVQDKRES